MAKPRIERDKITYINIKDGADIGCGIGKVVRYYFIPKSYSNKKIAKIFKWLN